MLVVLVKLGKSTTLPTNLPLLDKEIWRKHK
jgi:hypothetical protein